MDRPRRIGDPAIPRPCRTLEGLGPGIRSREFDRHAFAAEGPERWRLKLDQLSEQGGRRHPVADPDLDRGWGSCRDFAVLFVEAARSLGFGARIVSGYLYNPDQDVCGIRGAGSTHAWAEVYVPGAGWITFDPTNRSVGGFNLIPVAVARDIRQVMPVAGSFVGTTDAFRAWRWKLASKLNLIGETRQHL